MPSPAQPASKHVPGIPGNVTLIVLAVAVGALAGYAALGLLWMIGRVQNLFFGFDHARVYSAASTLDPLQVLLIPALGGLVVGLFVRYVIPGARNYGPEDAMEAVRRSDARLSLRVGLASAMASALAVGSGGSVGRYGPTVHLGASVAAWIGTRLQRARAERHVLIGCGVAAAISASFSAPLAGVLFAHEVMLETFARRGFVAITIASVTGQVVARSHDMHFSLVSLTGYHIGYNHEYLLFAFVGLTGGLLAVTYMRTMEGCGSLAARVRLPGPLKPALAGLFVGAVATRYPQVLGLGDEAIHDAIGQLFTLPLLLVLLLAKLLAASLCRGFGFPGGVVGPVLLIGALLGSILGQSFTRLDPDLVSSVPVYAVAGMGAVTSCVIGAPIATILIVFELTGSYALTTAVMVAVVVANMTANRLFPFSWFQYQLHRRGVDTSSGREVRIMRSRTIAELVSPDVDRVAPGTTISEARRRALALGTTELLVAGDDGVFRGQLDLAALVNAEDAGRGGDAVSTLTDMPGIVLRLDDTLDDAMRQLRYYMGTCVPVVNSEAGMILEGVVFQSSIIGAYNDAVTQARTEEQGG